MMMMRRLDCVGRCSLCVNLPTTRSLYLSEIRTKQVEFAVTEVAVKNPVGKKVHFLLYDISYSFMFAIIVVSTLLVFSNPSFARECTRKRPILVFDYRT